MRLITLLLCAWKLFPVKAVGLLPNSFSLLERSVPVNYSDDSLLVACNRSWSVLASIPTVGSIRFPHDLFTSRDSLSPFHVYVNCSSFGVTNYDRIDLRFLLPQCEKEYVGLKEDQITYRVEVKLSGELWVKRMNKCRNDTEKDDAFKGSAEIGYVNDNNWFMLRRTKTLNTRGVAIGLIIFGNDTGRGIDNAVNQTMNVISEIYFNHTLIYQKQDFIMRDPNSTCPSLDECYQAKSDINAEKAHRFEKFFGLFVLMAFLVGVWFVIVIIYVLMKVK